MCLVHARVFEFSILKESKEHTKEKNAIWLTSPGSTCQLNVASKDLKAANYRD